MNLVTQLALVGFQVVDVPMVYNPIVVTISSFKSLFFNGFQS